jgi:hypothetical protein
VSDGSADSLAEVVEQITNAGEPDEPITVDDIVEAIGQRSFGPLIVVPGLIVLSPLSGMPGVPTLGGVAVLLIAGQMLVGRESLWLPQMLRRRTIGRDRMAKAGRFLMPVARFADRFTRRRWDWLTKKPYSYLIAAACVLIALVMPPLEAIIFANVLTAAAICAFGLALVADDGLLAGIAFALTAGSFYLLVTMLLL